MEPKAVDLEELAITDPVAAYGLFLGIPRLPYVSSMSGSFPILIPSDTPQANPDGTLTPQVPVKATLPTGDIAQRTWIDNITYDLKCPNVFANNVFKTQFDAFLKQSPGIDIELKIFAGPKYDIAQGFTPLENLVNLIRADRWPTGWMIERQRTIQGLFKLTQSPGGVPAFILVDEKEVSQGPYNFTVTFNCWQFKDRRIDELEPYYCAQKLFEAGILKYLAPDRK